MMTVQANEDNDRKLLGDLTDDDLKNLKQNIPGYLKQVTETLVNSNPSVDLAGLQYFAE